MKEKITHRIRRSLQPARDSLGQFSHDLSHIKEVIPAMKSFSALVKEEFRAYGQSALSSTREFVNKKETQAFLKALATENLGWMLFGLTLLAPIDNLAVVKPISEGLKAGIPFDETMKIYWSFITQTGIAGPLFLGIANLGLSVPIISGARGIAKKYRENLQSGKKKSKNKAASKVKK
ncbi:hypothetical protein HZA76_00815 [Candidatus Roizmanbacteria bacterium]|nr:hypothetical protein [Candidatus Roizmanbacteria bacterium]